MRRRDFVASLGAAAVISPLPIAAQQAARRARLGILIYSTPERDFNTESFLGGLRELGYHEGQNVEIEYRFAEGKPGAASGTRCGVGAAEA
jgi:putative ABC transport system substrate-binding protein